MLHFFLHIINVLREKVRDLGPGRFLNELTIIRKFFTSQYLYFDKQMFTQLNISRFFFDDITHLYHILSNRGIVLVIAKINDPSQVSL